MSYVRVSIMQPHQHERAQIEKIIDDLLRISATLPGFLSGNRLIPHDESQEIWRIAHWESEHAADLAAQDQRILALRSDLIRVLGEDRHEERGFQTA